MLPRPFSLKLCALSLALMTSAVAAAQQKGDSALVMPELRQVVVTGTRSPKPLLKTPVLTQVISGEDIRLSDATDIRELLTQVLPGVEFTYAQNQQVHLNFSGFGGQSVLLLVDGERLAGETMDDVDFSRLSTLNIDHIEIVKGASSALYGSNAAGGVINIITKEIVKPLGVTIAARLGRHDSQRYSARLETADSHLGNTFSLLRSAEDNYSLSSDAGAKARVVSTVFGDKTWHFDDRLSYRLTPSLRLSGRAGYFFRQTERSRETPERYRDFNAGLRTVWTVDRKSSLEAAWSFDQYDKSSYLRQQGLDVRSYSDVQNAVRLLYNRNIGADVLTAGADFLYDYLLNTKLSPARRSDKSADAFAQYDMRINDLWEIVAALRYDYYPDRDMNRLTPKVSLRHTPLPHLNVRFGYGMGFRAPTLKEMYYNFDMMGIWTIEGNPRLRAETSHNFNLSMEYTRGRYSFLLNGYCNSVRNKITSGNPYYASADELTPRLPYVNIRRFFVSGIEASARARWSRRLSARLSYAYVHEQTMRSRDGEALASPYLPSRRHSLTGHIDWSRDFSPRYGLDIALDGRLLSSMDNKEYINYYDISQGMTSVHSPAYTMWKLFVCNRFSKHLRLNLTLDNLLNYRPRYYYLNSPLTDGTNVMIGLELAL